MEHAQMTHINTYKWPVNDMTSHITKATTNIKKNIFFCKKVADGHHHDQT